MIPMVLKKKNGQNRQKESQNDDSISANSESYKRSIRWFAALPRYLEYFNSRER